MIVLTAAVPQREGSELDVEAVVRPFRLEDGRWEAGRRGGADPDAGERILELRPPEGSALTYTVTVRNPTSEVVSVTGVAADEDRDGPFVPERVDGGPVQVPPGGASTQALGLGARVEIRSQGR